MRVVIQRVVKASVKTNQGYHQSINKGLVVLVGVGKEDAEMDAAPPEKSVPLYDYFVRKLNELTGRPVATGVFGAHMEVEIINDGPVTIVMDTENKV
ncbi:MAG: D-aminoacyl-tRNA deacylase [Bacteroidales bacterium]|nr:D-aminoacyl-tRNA deacylase [Bacteroidales bacterium]